MSVETRKLEKAPEREGKRRPLERMGTAEHVGSREGVPETEGLKPDGDEEMGERRRWMGRFK